MPDTDESFEHAMCAKLVAPKGTPVKNRGKGESVSRVKISNLRDSTHSSTQPSMGRRVVFSQFERLLRLLYD